MLAGVGGGAGGEDDVGAFPDGRASSRIRSGKYGLASCGDIEAVGAGWSMAVGYCHRRPSNSERLITRSMLVSGTGSFWARQKFTEGVGPCSVREKYVSGDEGGSRKISCSRVSVGVSRSEMWLWMSTGAIREAAAG